MLGIGPITKLGSTSNSVQLSIAAPAGGTGPYTQQLYKSFTTGFSPGPAYLIPGATGLTFTDTNLLPGVTYYYVAVVTDLGNGSATANSAQLTVAVPAGSPVEMNVFNQTPVLGQVTMAQNPNTVSVVFDSGIGATRYPAGTAVKQINPTGVPAGSGLSTLPHVTPCTEDDDVVLGFIQYNVRSADYGAGEMMEISKDLNEQFQMATANGTAGDPMQLDLSAPGGLQTVVADSGATICGTAVDQPIIGQLFRLSISLGAVKQSA